MVNHRQRADRRVASRGVNLIVRKIQRTGRPHIWPPALIFGFFFSAEGPWRRSIIAHHPHPTSLASEGGGAER